MPGRSLADSQNLTKSINKCKCFIKLRVLWRGAHSFLQFRFRHCLFNIVKRSAAPGVIYIPAGSSIEAWEAKMGELTELKDPEQQN